MISALNFLAGLNWIDGTPLVLEPYRRDIFRRALDDRDGNGHPQYTMVLAGRAKKNWKSADLNLAGLYCLVCRRSPQGSDVLIAANDVDQARADLDLAKRLVGVNPALMDELEILSDTIRRRDGDGTMRIIPAQNVAGQHGKTAAFVGFDEIHAYASWDLLEALAPDPTRPDALTWITSYDSILDLEGAPLHDLKKIGMAGTDPKLLFSWYSADYCTDPAFAHLPPDERANPSMARWPEGRAYLDQQRRRLPSARFRRLHHNLPGAPQGAFFSQDRVERAIAPGRQQIEPQAGINYLAAVDMSGGSNDDATFSIVHWDDNRKVAVQDVLVDQGAPKPFNPREAVSRFAALAKRYRCKQVHGDPYAGQTFRRDFEDLGLEYVVTAKSASEFYEDLEVALNCQQAEMLDLPTLRRQLLTLVRKGAQVTHPSGQHDDWANSSAIALVSVNPDLGAVTDPHILTFYQRWSERVMGIEQPKPQFGYAFASEPLCMVRVPRGAEAVLHGCSLLNTTEHLIASMTRAAARRWLTQPQWRDLNANLARELGMEEAA